MLASILALFSAHTHPLTLVSDPDRLLAGEMVLQELVRRGFRLIQEEDPILLHHRTQAAQPYTAEQPVIVITAGDFYDVPYNLYQPAYRIQLSLHQLFPNLVYPVLQALSPEQIEKLAACQQPQQPLSRQKTIDYLLSEVFEVPANLSHPGALVAWLVEYHSQRSLLPQMLRARLAEQLRCYPVYQQWDIDRLLEDGQAFEDLIQSQWQLAVEQLEPGNQVKEGEAVYHLSFTRSAQLQLLVPHLVNRGFLHQVQVQNAEGLPSWALPGLTQQDGRTQRYRDLLQDIEIHLHGMVADNQPSRKWHVWSILAEEWAELSSLKAQLAIERIQVEEGRYRAISTDIDNLFYTWLRMGYTPLGTQRLPKPHHIFHVPHYLNYLRQSTHIDRQVLLVLDGLSLADWAIIKPAWLARHVDWRVKTDYLLAQVPTITPISRYALISGLRPADFLVDGAPSMSESRAWELFWSQQGVASATCKVLSLAYDRQIDQSPELLDPRVSNWCLIDDTIDKIAHSATLGTVEQQTTLQLWLDIARADNSMILESYIDSFLERGYTVYVASDHGHIEAIGFGQPAEGLMAEHRGQRARIYLNHMMAVRIQTAYPDTVIWENDGILPDHVATLVPTQNGAFAHYGEKLVTHGGISIEEVLVPFATISKERT